MGAAAPATVVSWRHELTDWLEARLDLGAERRADVVLAVDEALSNSAEFAYRHGGSGDVTLEVAYSAPDERLAITVLDSGTWREVDDTCRPLSRGRGIPLMEALADRLDIERGAAGTTVWLTFEQCRVRRGSMT